MVRNSTKIAKFQDIPCLEFIFLNSMIFQVFYDVYELCFLFHGGKGSIYWGGGFPQNRPAGNPVNIYNTCTLKLC